MSARNSLISHAAACRAAAAAKQSLPPLSGADLSCPALYAADLRGADLSGADLSLAYLRDSDLRGTDLRGADLGGADLGGADLGGAQVAEGVVVAAAAGTAGGYRWYAILLQNGVVILQYGCERHPLDVWRVRGPEYGARHGHDIQHWAVGPAVAIAAAERLAST